MRNVFTTHARQWCVLAMAVSLWATALHCESLAEDGVESDYKPGPMLSAFLDGPMADVDEIVFAKQTETMRAWLANSPGWTEDNLQRTKRKPDH